MLSTSIDKYCYISCRYLPPFFDYKHRIVYSQVEELNEIDQIRHPAVRGVFQWMNISDGIEIHHDGDLPARSGLGSSSSFTVGLIHAMKALRGEMVSKRELAQSAVHVEREVIHETVGSQDQVVAAYGGFNRIDFNRDDSFAVTPMILEKSRLINFQDHCMLFFTGVSRVASEIAAENLKNINQHEKSLMTIRAMVEEAIEILQNPKTSLNDFGKMLHESWLLKRSFSKKVSSPHIDEIYEAGRSAGAIGGKILGAGGGGFIFFFVKPENRAKVQERLKKLVHVTFRFDFTGSKIVIYEPNNFQ